MRVLLVNTSERIGGAAVACSRLMEALNNHGVKARMLVRDKQTDQITVAALPKSVRLRWNFLWERFVIWCANRLSRANLFAVDIANAGTDITRLPEFQEADIIHLHWVNQGMLSLRGIDKILKCGKPVVWTMHDMWPSTGICHHARDCNRYAAGCGKCPYLHGGGSMKDLSYIIYKRKKRILQGRHVAYVACSNWLEGRARESSLLTGQRIMTIPNPISTRLLCPQDQREARLKCLLPMDKKLIIFGSAKTTDKRKGVDYFVEACQMLVEERPELREQWGVVVFGNHSETLVDVLPLKVYPQQFVTDASLMACLYNAADVYVMPSLEENLPNTIMEAMACGVPCVGFNVGGIPEMIDHHENGYVAAYQSATDLAAGIKWVLEAEDYTGLSERAVRKVTSHYSEHLIAKRYIDLYTNLLPKID